MWIIVQCRVSNCETNHRIDICCKNHRFFCDTCLLRGTERYAQNALVACCRWKWTQDFVPLKYNLTTKLWLASRFGTLRTMLWLVDAIGGWTSGVRTCPHHCSGSIQLQFHTGKTIIRPLENYKRLKIRTLNHKHPNCVTKYSCKRWNKIQSGIGFSCFSKTLCVNIAKCFWHNNCCHNTSHMMNYRELELSFFLLLSRRNRSHNFSPTRPLARLAVGVGPAKSRP